MNWAAWILTILHAVLYAHSLGKALYDRKLKRFFAAGVLYAVVAVLWYIAVRRP